MASPILSNRYLRFFLITLLSAFVLALSYFRVFDLYELQTYDWRCQMRGLRAVSPNIAIIGIWDDSLKAFGEWPIDRKHHAELIDALKYYGAKSVLFDVLFVESKPADALIARSARAAGNAYFPVAFKDPKFINHRFVAEDYLAPLVKLCRRYAKGVAYVNVVPDMDGKRRRIFPMVSFNGENYFQLGFLAAMDFLGIKPEEISLIPGKKIRLPKGEEIPLDDHGYMMVNYAGRWAEVFQHFSYYDIIRSYQQILAKEEPDSDFSILKDKICFVGLTATATTDVNATPLDPIYPMVGLHANVLNSILEKDFIRRLGRLPNLVILTLLVFWVLSVSLRRKPLFAFRVTFLTLIFFTTTVLFCFKEWGLWIDLFYPFSLTVVVFAVSVLSRTMFEIKKRELIEGELKIASQIQKSFLPESLPQRKGLSLALYMKPAKAVGGDLYTFVPLSADKIGVMIGDVSGKGTPAALFMAKSVSEFKFSARGKTDPAEVLAALNDSIASESTGGLFVTLTYVIFDLKTRKLCLSNGGHLPMVRVGAAGENDLLSSEGGMPIGVIAGVPFSDFESELKTGDCFALYSDGVSEARNRKKEEYDVQTLQKMITQYRHQTAQEILDKTVEDLNRFMGKAEQHDDITLIVMKVDGEG